MVRRIAALALLLSVLLLGSAHATVRITDPWPDPARITGVREESVRFPSTSPFTPADAAHAPAATAIGELYLPADAAPNHTTPAVVMLHGAAGRVAERGATYGPQLAAMGVAVLVIDTYGARRDMATGFIGRVLHITETMFVADAYAGLRYLATLPDDRPAPRRAHRLLLWRHGDDVCALRGDGRPFRAARVALRRPCLLLRPLRRPLRRQPHDRRAAAHALWRRGRADPPRSLRPDRRRFPRGRQPGRP